MNFQNLYSMDGVPLGKPESGGRRASEDDASSGRLLVDAIAFRQPFLKDNPEQVHVVYKLQMNRYAGSETIQLMVEYLEIP